MYLVHILQLPNQTFEKWDLLSSDYQNPANNPIYGNLQSTFKEAFKWAGYNEGDNAGGHYGIWAPDVMYNEEYIWADGS